MRDQERIARLLKLVEREWNRYPDLRFMQLVQHLYAGISEDWFYTEDDVLEAKLSGRNRAVLRGGEWDGFEVPADLKEYYLMLTMEPKAPHEDQPLPGVDYCRTDEWDGDRRIYQFQGPLDIP